MGYDSTRSEGFFNENGTTMKRASLQFSKVVVQTILLLTAAITADAGVVKLAESGDSEPNGTNQFFEFYGLPTLNDRGEVAFDTDLRNNGFLQGYGIYLADGETVKILAHAPQPAPDLNGNFYQFYDEVALNSTSQVFEVDLRSTLGGGNDDSAIYELNGNTLTLLAREGAPAPGNSGKFKSLETVPVRINRLGQTAFTDSTSSNLIVVCVSTGGTLTRVAFSKEELPDGSGQISGLESPTLNNHGQVAVYASILSTNLFAYLLADGSGLKFLARGYEDSPDGNGYFIEFPATEAAFNDSGQLAFVADLSGTSGGSADNQGLYRADGSTTVQLARKGQFVPGGNGRFLDFGPQVHAVINNSGVVAFRADLTGTSGGSVDNAAIYLTDGNTITQIVRKGQTAPDGNGTYSAFGVPALNNKGQVAFTATLTGTIGNTATAGIFLTDASLAVQQIVRSGQVIDGETLSNPNFLSGPDAGGLSGLNDNGQLAFLAGLNGNGAVFLWSRPEITAVTPVGNDVRVDLNSYGAKTNVLQSASNLGSDFVTVGTIILPGTKLVRTNFWETGVATNNARFYRLYETN